MKNERLLAMLSLCLVACLQGVPKTRYHSYAFRSAKGESRSAPRAQFIATMTSFSAATLCDIADWEGAIVDGDRCFKRKQRGNRIPRAVAQGASGSAPTNASKNVRFCKVSVQATGCPRESTASAARAKHMDEIDES